jgi:hypothetical protein
LTGARRDPGGGGSADARPSRYVASARNRLKDYGHRLRGPAIPRLLPWIALAAILGVSSLLRLYHLAELTPYYGDQGRDSTVIEGLIRNGQLPLLGPSSSTTTFSRGPAVYYLMAPGFLAFGGNPVGGATVVVVADVLAVAFLGLLGREIAGWPSGLVAAGLWATNTLTTQYGRIMWNPQLLAPFEMLMLLAMIGLARDRPRWFLLFLPSWTLAWQLHDQALLLLPMILAWWAIVRPRVGLRIAAAATGLAALSAAPFLVYELTHDFTNVRAMVAQAFGHGGATAVPSQLDRLGTVGSTGGALISGPAAPILWGVALTGLVWILVRLRGPQRPALLLVVLLAATSALYAFWPAPIQDYYLYILAPVPFLLIGTGLGGLLSAGRRYRPLALAVGAFLVLNIAVGGFSVLLTLRSQPTNARALGSMEAQIAAINRDAGGQPFAVRLVTNYPYQDWDVPYRYLLELHYGPSPNRADLPTYVIYDAPRLQDVADGESVAGAQIVRYPAPTVGPELLPAGGLAALDGHEVHAGGPAVSAATGVVSQTIAAPGGRRYLISFDHRCAFSARCGVSAKVLDSSGAPLRTVATPCSPSVFENVGASNWSTSSFFVDVPSGSADLVVTVNDRGNVAADFRNLSVRAVMSWPIPGGPIY